MIAKDVGPASEKDRVDMRSEALDCALNIRSSAPCQGIIGSSDLHFFFCRRWLLEVKTTDEEELDKPGEYS